MSKINAEGKAVILTTEQIERILSHAKPKVRLFLQLLRYTGERPSAVASLKQSDCYYNHGQVREYLVFPSISRKKAGGKKPEPREVFVVPELQLELKQFQRPKSPFLFPSNKKKGQPINYYGARQWLESILAKCGLQSYGITLYSYRRTFITKLAKWGLNLQDLKTATGHQSTSSLLEYIEVDRHAIRKAMLNL